MKNRRFLKRWMIWLYFAMIDLPEVEENEAAQHTLCCASGLMTIIAAVLAPFIAGDASYFFLSLSLGFLLYLTLGLLLHLSSSNRSAPLPWQRSGAS